MHDAGIDKIARFLHQLLHRLQKIFLVYRLVYKKHGIVAGGFRRDSGKIIVFYNVFHLQKVILPKGCVNIPAVVEIL